MKIEETKAEDKSWEEWFNLLKSEAIRMNATQVETSFEAPFSTKGWVLSIQVMTKDEYDRRSEP